MQSMLGAVERKATNLDGGKHGTVIDLPDHPGLMLLRPDATRDATSIAQQFHQGF